MAAWLLRSVPGISLMPVTNVGPRVWFLSAPLQAGAVRFCPRPRLMSEFPPVPLHMQARSNLSEQTSDPMAAMRSDVNVFVLCTGRSGSLTFANACRHISNFTSGHETRVPQLGAARLAYPPCHIEVDHRLAWFLGKLDEKYGNRAFYVHLSRDPERVAASWSRRFDVPGGMASTYRDGILAHGYSNRPARRLEAAADYIETVQANIRAFLKDKTHVMNVAVETAEADFPRFWSWISAEGDLNAAMREWTVRHDTDRVRLRGRQRARDAALRIWRAIRPAP